MMAGEGDFYLEAGPPQMDGNPRNLPPDGNPRPPGGIPISRRNLVNQMAI